jgi:hypothetical protein
VKADERTAYRVIYPNQIGHQKPQLETAIFRVTPKRLIRIDRGQRESFTPEMFSLCHFVWNEREAWALALATARNRVDRAAAALATARLELRACEEVAAL